MATSNPSFPSSSSGSGVNRVLNKLRISIGAGKYYEAHQMYRTLYFRYLNQKRYNELLELLYDGALELLRHKQNSSGADLSILFVDTLVKAEANVSNQILEKLARLFELILPDGGPERSIFLSSALKWSSRESQEFRFGHPKLHKQIALILWKEMNYQESFYHFLRSMDGTDFSEFLIEYHVKKGYSSEIDLFIAQAVLQLLCLENKVSATIVFFNYTERHPDISKGPPFFLPLLNFLWFLLLTVESGTLTAFTILCEQYQPSIRRDPSYSEYLDKIGQLFFGVPKPKRGGMFGNFLQSFLGSYEDDDGDDAIAEEAGPSRKLKAEELD